jgi:hypothetical protein
MVHARGQLRLGIRNFLCANERKRCGSPKAGRPDD